jgi:hypothetical protein
MSYPWSELSLQSTPLRSTSGLAVHTYRVLYSKAERYHSNDYQRGTNDRSYVYRLTSRHFSSSLYLLSNLISSVDIPTPSNRHSRWRYIHTIFVIKRQSSIIGEDCRRRADNHACVCCRISCSISATFYHWSDLTTSVTVPAPSDRHPHGDTYAPLSSSKAELHHRRRPSTRIRRPFVRVMSVGPRITSRQHYTCDQT